MKHSLVIPALLVLLSPDTAMAEDIETLSDVNVTARPIGLQSIEHVAQPISVIRSEELLRKQSSTIGETLKNVPGVTTDRFSPLASRPVIRGLSGPRVKMLENGLGSLDMSAISVDHAVTIDPIQAEQIEIFRGPSTLLYGSEASGGLVNVATNRIPDYVPEAFKSKIYFRYNTNSLEKLISFRGIGGHEKLAFHVDGVNRDAKNYESANGTVGNSYYDLTNLNFGTSYIDDWGYVGISYGHFGSTHGVPVNPDEPDELKFIDSKQNRYDINAQIDLNTSFVKSIRFQTAYNDYFHTEFDSPTEPGTRFSNEQLQGRVEFQYAQIGLFSGVIGSQFGYRDVIAVGDEAFLPKTNTNNFAIFLLEETDISDNLHFEIGGRYEFQESDPISANEVSHNVYSISSGIHWHFTDTASLSLNLNRSQRAPAAEELFTNGPHEATSTFEIGQAGLDEETANNIDLSISHELGRFQWNTSLFLNYIENFIFLQGLDRNNDGAIDEVDDDGNLGGKLTLVQFQQDNAIFYGFEFVSKFSIFSNNYGSLSWNLFADYVRAERENGENLPRISPARIGTGLDYIFNRFRANVELTNILAQKDNAVLETDTGGYMLLNLNANYALVKGEQTLDVFMLANNLLDEDGTLHTSIIKDRALIMGQSLMVGFQAGF